MTENGKPPVQGDLKIGHAGQNVSLSIGRRHVQLDPMTAFQVAIAIQQAALQAIAVRVQAPERRIAIPQMGIVRS